MTQILIHKGSGLSDLLNDRITHLPVALCDNMAVFKNYPDLTPLLQGRQIFLYQQDPHSSLYLGLMPKTVEPDPTAVTIPCTDILDKILDRVVEVEKDDDGEMGLSIQFESLTKIEVLRYMSASFLKIVSMEYDIDFTDSTVTLHNSKDAGTLLQVTVSPETVLQRTSHHPRNDEGGLLISVTFKVS